jgi:hypothetical protein
MKANPTSRNDSKQSLHRTYIVWNPMTDDHPQVDLHDMFPCRACDSSVAVPVMMRRPPHNLREVVGSIPAVPLTGGNLV